MRGRDVVSLGSIAVWFTKPVTGVAAADLLVNGAQATAVSEAAGSAGPYRFSGWATPAPGAVLVTLLPGAIRDVDSKPFAGDAWGYVLHPHPVINELLASNNTVIADEFGDFDDYIEIFNPASISIDLGGMHLTDSLALPSQYPIPAGMVIAPLGHLLFWADGEPSEGATHTNFTLLRAGEQIGLFDADLMPIDTPVVCDADHRCSVGTLSGWRARLRSDAAHARRSQHPRLLERCGLRPADPGMQLWDLRARPVCRRRGAGRDAVRRWELLHVRRRVLRRLLRRRHPGSGRRDEPAMGVRQGRARVGSDGGS